MPDLDFTTEEVKDTFRRTAKTQKKFVRSEQEYAEENKQAKKSVDAYFSDSWDDKIAKSRKAKGLPVSDVARFAPIVDTISGNERQNRTDIHAFAFEQDDQLTTDLVNLYLKYRTRRDKHWHEDSLIFINGIIASRSHCEFFLRNNPNDGSLETVRIERPSREVFLDKPFRRFDASDSTGLTHVQWLPVDEVKRLFKHKISDVRLLDFRPRSSKTPVTEISHALDEYDFPDEDHPEMFFKDEKREVRLIRRWERRKKPIFRVLNPNPRTFEEILIATEDAKREALSAAMAFIQQFPEVGIDLLETQAIEIDGEIISELNAETIEAVASELIEEQHKDTYSYHVISGRVELEWVEDWGDFLPWSTFFCYFADGRSGGLYDRIKDEIQEVNFIHAKLMQRLGTLGKMPLGIETDASDMDPEDIRANFEDGGVILFKSGALAQRKAEVFEDKTLNSIPGYLALEESLTNNVKEKTGANDPIQGKSPGANTAGIAIELLQRRGAALIAPIEDNFKRFRVNCAEIELKMLLRAHDLRPNWTSMKMARIIGGMIENTGQRQAEPLFNALQSAQQDDTDDSVSLLINNLLTRMRTMEYDFTLDEFVMTPTIRMSVLQMLANISTQLGFPVDPSIIIENLELPQKEKDRLIQFLTAAAGQEQLVNRQPQGSPAGNGGLSTGGL